MRLTKKSAVLIVSGALALTGSAIGANAILNDSTEDGAPVQYSPSIGVLPTIPGSPEQVLAYLAKGLPLIANPRVVNEAIPTEDGRQSDASGQFLYYDLAVTSFEGRDSVEAIWEGQLFTGAALDVFRDRGFGVLAGADATLVRTDGARRPIGGGFGKVVANQEFESIPPGLSERIAATAPDLGLTNVQVRNLDIVQGALVIEASTATPEKTVKSLVESNPIATLTGRSATDFEGTLLIVRNSAGSPVLIDGTAPRAAAGIRWVDPAMGVEVTR